MNIPKLQRWLLRKLIRDNIHQGPHLHDNIAEMFRLVMVSSRQEFTEDNDATQYAFLRGRFEEAIDSTFTYVDAIRDNYTPAEGDESPQRLSKDKRMRYA